MGRVRLIATAIALSLMLPERAHVAAEPPSSTPSAARSPDQLKERDRLKKEVDALRRAGKFAEAASAAERLLELQEHLHGKINSDVAAALTQNAELCELQGDWDRALSRRREALTVSEQVHPRSVRGFRDYLGFFLGTGVRIPFNESLTGNSPPTSSTPFRMPGNVANVAGIAQQNCLVSGFVFPLLEAIRWNKRCVT
jgi:tetratricopeptide (TPR) repeat protein